MKSTLYISGLMLFFILGCAVTECMHKPVPEVVHVEKGVIKEKIVEKEKEVVKWKQAKEKITYITHFDTVVTKEFVIGELIKCDSIVKIDSVIIASQDTIIADQKQVIVIVESDNSKLKRDLKKQKRKNTITKIVAVVVIVGSIILTR
jgi:hypothetical protein